MTENDLYELLYENLGETNHLKKIVSIPILPYFRQCKRF